MFKFKMVGRKPASYSVETDNCKEAARQKGRVFQTGLESRGMRWALEYDGSNTMFFPSRRSAFTFFQTGKKFITKPVFQTLKGRTGNKRIR